MKRVLVFLCLLSLSIFVFAAVMEDFEDQVASFHEPHYSGSTHGIVSGSDSMTITDERANDRLDPSVGSPGTYSMKLVWTWDSSYSESDPQLVRETCYPNRYEFTDTTGFGFYYWFNGSFPLEVSICVRENPANDSNYGTEYYENTEHFTLSPAPYWQYFYVNFSNATWDDHTKLNWAVDLGLGDGVLDITDQNPPLYYEAFLFYPGDTLTQDVNVIIYLDDLHDGAEQTPQALPTSATDWELFQ